MLSQAIALSQDVDKRVAAAEAKADFEIIKRVNVQLSAIQQQINNTITPIIAEKNAATERRCKAAKLAVAECAVDPDLGTVVKLKQKEEEKKDDKK